MSAPRRTGAAAVVALVLAATVASLWAPSAGASSGVELGWWTRSPGQQAPEDGFAVASAPDGPVTVAALRVDLGAGVTGATLVAEEAGGLNQAMAALALCPTTTAWEPGGGGDLDDAPATTCGDDAVAFERDAETSTWSADVTSLLAGADGVVAIAVVPGPVDGPLAGAFEVGLAPVSLEVVPITTSAPSAPADPSPAASPAPPAFGGSTSPPPRAPVLDLRPSAPTATVPSGGSVSIPPVAEEPAAETTTTTALAGPDVAAGPIVGTSFGPVGAPDHRTAGRAALFVAISAAVGAAVAAGSRTLRQRGVALRSG